MTDSRCRILHVVGTMNPGGLETWLLQVLTYIGRDNLQFDFCICGSEPGIYADKVAALGGRIIACPRSSDLWSFRRNFRRILKDGKYDVVHSHVCFFSGILLRWANAEGVPIRIAHSHNAHDGKPDIFLRRFYRLMMKSWIRRYATHGLAASKLAARELFGENWQTDKRIKILDYGLALLPFQEFFDRSEVRAEFGIPPGAPVVGHVGRFDIEKNHRFLLEIASAVKKSRPDVHFLLIGDGPLRSEIERQASAMGLSSNMHFSGVRTDVPRLMMGAMNFFVFPSVREGFGFCLLEAQAAGLQCLVSDSVPHEVAKVPGSVEFLRLSAGTDQWSAKVIEGLESRLSSVSAAREEFQSRFSIQRSLHDLACIYLSPQALSEPIPVEQHV